LSLNVFFRIVNYYFVPSAYASKRACAAFCFGLNQDFRQKYKEYGVMKRFPLAILAASIGASLTLAQAVSAKPPTVFMLQFGSFESQEEADARLKSLKTKHSGLVGPLSSRVLEVALPDSLTVFRTQAGPVSSRAEAQSVCAQLASQGDECYVVETAMVQQPAAPAVAQQKPVTQTLAKAEPAKPTEVKESKASEAKPEAKVTAALPAKATPQTEIVAPQPKQAAAQPIVIVPNPNVQASLPKAQAEQKTALSAKMDEVAETPVATQAIQAPEAPTASAAPEADVPPAESVTAKPPVNVAASTKPVMPIAPAVPIEARRDPRNRDALAKLGAVEHPDASEAKAQSLVQSAAPVTTSSEVKLTPRATAKPKKERSLWSDINPFSDDEEETLEAVRPAETKITPEKEKAAALLAQQAEADAGMERVVPATSIEKTSAPKEAVKAEAKPPVKPTIGGTGAPQKTTLVQEVKPAATQEEKPAAPIQVVPVQPARTLTKEEAMRLPPPPPLNDESRRIFEQNKREMPIATAPQNAQAAPGSIAVTQSGAPMMPKDKVTAPAPVAAPFAAASDETLKRSGKPVVGGKVNVEEAKRVPLTQAEQQALPTGAKMYVPSGSSIAPADASIPLTQKAPRAAISPAVPQGDLASPAVALPPSAPMVGKSQWADIAKFSSPQAALAYWERFRKAQPDFPVVRVRVVQTYAEKMHNVNDVTLRVGPFAKPQSIDYLCKHLGADNLTCRPVIDSGASAASSDARTRALQGEANLATQEMTKGDPAAKPAHGQYWMQLGSYPSLGQAQNSWGDLQKKHGSALSGMSPNIAVPALTSASRPTFRLRAGPFATELAANQACMRLQSAGGSCVISAQ
jgi:cell division protein FtsN